MGFLTALFAAYMKVDSLFVPVCAGLWFICLPVLIIKWGYKQYIE